MKTNLNLLIIACCITTISCKKYSKLIQATPFGQNFDLNPLAQTNTLDTILIYEVGCVGCIVKPHTFYYFTKNGNLSSVRKISGNYVSSSVNTADVFSKFYEGIFRNKDYIDLSHPILLHYRFKKVSILEQGKLIFQGEIYIPNNYNWGDSHLKQYIQFLDGELMWIESNDLLWNN